MRTSAEKLIFILNNEGKGALIPFPAAFEYPLRKTVKGTDYFKTDKVRTYEGQDALIYTEKNCALNLDDYATGEFKEESLDVPVRNGKTDAQRVQALRELLADQIAYYREYAEKEKAGEVDDSYLYDTMYEQFNDLSSGDFLKIIEELL